MAIGARLARYAVPMVLGGALVAVYFHAGVAKFPQAQPPRAVILSPKSDASSALSSTANSSSRSGSETTTSSTTPPGLIVIAPTNRVLSYESSSAAPVEIDPSENEGSSTTLGLASTTVDQGTKTANQVVSSLDGGGEVSSTTTVTLSPTIEPSGDATTTTAASADGASSDH